MKRLALFVVALAAAPFLLPWVALGDTRTDSVSMTPRATNPIPSGRGGLYTLSSTGKPQLVDAAGLLYPAGEARHIYTYAGAPGAAVLGDCWIDSTDTYRLWCKEGVGNIRQRTDVNATGNIGIAASPAVFLAHADSALATQYLGGVAYGAASATQLTMFVVHTAQSVRKLACSFGTAPGGVVSDVITVQKSSDHGATWADLATTCTVTGAGQTCNSVVVSALAQYDRLAVKIVRNALSASADYNCEIVVS